MTLLGFALLVVAAVGFAWGFEPNICGAILGVGAGLIILDGICRRNRR